MEESLIEKKKKIQSECLSITNRYRRRGCAISMGVGKTLIGLLDMNQELQMNPDARFLVVAPKKSIFKTWKDEAVKFGLEHVLSHITFTTYLSLSKQAKSYDVIYLDEVHNLLDSHDFYLSFYTGKILGLTGTPPRYKNSEKGQLVNKFCPIVYSYTTDEAVNDDILNNYVIYVHSVELDIRKLIKQTTKAGGTYYVSEKYLYDTWTRRIDEATTPKSIKMARIMRMKCMMNFVSKTSAARDIMNMQDKKCIIFCNTTEQADAVCGYSYHSKNPNSEMHLQAFKEGKIDNLSCVLQLSEGVNIPNLKYGIIIHAYSNERKLSQRINIPVLFKSL